MWSPTEATTLFKRLDRWQRVLGLLLFCGTLGMASCASPDQYKKAIDERDSEISRLRDERANLKRDKQLLQAELDNMGAQLREASMRKIPQQALTQTANTGLEDLGIGYAYRDGVAVITIPSSITFGSGKATLSGPGKSALQTVAAVLRREHPGSVYSIEGHTDTDPISKSKFANNRELSLKRATAVLMSLVEDWGVADEQCVVVGHGEYRPSNPSKKSANRRVEIVVYGGK
ncbi:MAG: flagellar motor protein MotB [Planctomycetota bacterium]|jgi:flagellar motor protein MotB